MLNAITTAKSNAVNSSKVKYYDRFADSFNGSKRAAKTYWSILKHYGNASKSLIIPPLSVGNWLASDFLAKANLLNDLFSKQCSAIANNSSLPRNLTVETESRPSIILIFAQLIL